MCVIRSSMYVMTLLTPLNTSAVSRLKLAGAPCRPIVVRDHRNCVFRKGIVKAVKSRDVSSRFCCQKPLAMSKVENIFESDLPIVSMHSCTSFIAYLSSNEFLLISRQSCTIRKPPPFFGTQKTGEL